VLWKIEGCRKEATMKELKRIRGLKKKSFCKKILNALSAEKGQS